MKSAIFCFYFFERIAKVMLFIVGIVNKAKNNIKDIYSYRK
jgi:hypothetical protein